MHEPVLADERIKRVFMIDAGFKSLLQGGINRR
jgi:hypothetical protein